MNSLYVRFGSRLRSQTFIGDSYCWYVRLSGDGDVSSGALCIKCRDWLTTCNVNDKITPEVPYS